MKSFRRYLTEDKKFVIDTCVKAMTTGARHSALTCTKDTLDEVLAAVKSIPGVRIKKNHVVTQVTKPNNPRNTGLHITGPYRTSETAASYQIMITGLYDGEDKD